jgi:hypothetical protein
MTGVPRPELYPKGTKPPLLLGYHDEEDVFSAWDATKHRRTRHRGAKGGSNSLYVPLAKLVEARRYGIASHERVIAGAVHEVVIAFKPEAADHYLRIASALRVSGTANIAATAAATAAKPLPRAALTQKRKAVLRAVRQVVRDARFPAEVLDAYEGRCAFCGLAAKLVDAAHIKSVKQRGPDHVTNGLAACPTHHRAFDRGLLVIQDDYSIAVNTGMTDLLTTDDRQKLQRTLRNKLALPRDPTRRPDLRFVRYQRRQVASSRR